MRALVVDDEPLVRSELVYALERIVPDCKVSEAETGLEALAMLQASAYEVVFLDIHLQGVSGLEAVSVIKRLPKPPQVVFVSAHQAHAVDAFALAAFDYLLKPVTEERLQLTMKRMLARSRSPSTTAPFVLNGRLAVEDGDRTRLVSVAEVRYVEARGHVVMVSLYDEAFRFRGTLGECAERLEKYGFLRTHRAYLVNPQHVIELSPFLAGTYTLRVDNRARSEVPVSRSFVPSIRCAFEV